MKRVSDQSILLGVRLVCSLGEMLDAGLQSSVSVNKEERDYGNETKETLS